MDEIFQTWHDHQLKAIMLFAQLSSAMDFTGEEGYKRKFEYEFFKQSYTRRKFDRYYVNHYSKMLRDNNVESINIIPGEYYTYKREAITRDFKKQYIKESLNKVKNFYAETIEFLNTAIKTAVDNNKIQDISLFKKELECYNKKLKKLDRHLMKLADINYDLGIIETVIQPRLHEKYKKKEEEFRIEFK